MSADPQIFLGLSLRLAASGVLIQSLEVLSRWRELQDDRLFGWRAAGHPRNPARRIVRAVWTFPGCAWLLALRAALAAAAALVGTGSAAAFWLAAGLVLVQLGYNRRFTMLAGNSETMFLVAFATTCIGALPGVTERLQRGALLFLAAHALLAYLAAGAHKLRSRLWRSGARLSQIVAFGSYQFPLAARRAVDGRRRAQILSWSVIVLELALPFSPLLPGPLFWTLLAAGMAFHTAIALLMGLHGFWWAFAASYPAIVFAHQVVR